MLRPDVPPSFALEVGQRLEAGGVDQLWFIEDCFYTAAVSLAAATLARTERLTVGLGILPAVARNPAITAMEIATLARRGPGRVADGLVLAEGAGPAYLRWAIAQAGDPEPFRVSVFTVLCITDDARDAYRIMAPFVAGLCLSPTPNVRAHPNFDDMQDRWRAHGEEALVDMPAAWWRELGAIGTFDDAVAHIHALREAGAHDVSLFPAPDVAIARQQLDDVIRLDAAVH